MITVKETTQINFVVRITILAMKAKAVKRDNARHYLWRSTQSVIETINVFASQLFLSTNIMTTDENSIHS